MILNTIYNSALGLRLLDVRRHTLSRSTGAVSLGDLTVVRKQADRGSQVTVKAEAESLRGVAGHQERQRLRRLAEDPGGE